MNSETLITNSRVSSLNGIADQSAGKCVVYVMSRDQRVDDNFALQVAQQYALECSVPMTVVFVLKKIKGRSREHYSWMLSGLEQIERSLNNFNIPFMLLIGDGYERLSGIMEHLRPSAVFFDYSPLHGSCSFKTEFSSKHTVPMFVVDAHNIVPVWVASDKQEFSARTIRPKINRVIDEFLYNKAEIISHPFDWPGPVIGMSDLSQKIKYFLGAIPSNGQSGLINLFPPGPSGAKKVLKDFISNKFLNYHQKRNDPSVDNLLGLSPYLHFGNISSARIIREAHKYLESDSALQKSFDVLFEEIVIRKELSDNYCHYNNEYKSLKGAPSWSVSTLIKHIDDKRDYLYTRSQLEEGKTHDTAWNASQLQLLKTGKMHGYMRMYWAKKVLEWTDSPQEAIDILIYLNDFYSLDGHDPNGYVGILWSVAGLHDRPWGERQVYGSVRSMVYAGLKRKFDINKYEKLYNIAK